MGPKLSSKAVCLSLSYCCPLHKEMTSEGHFKVSLCRVLVVPVLVGTSLVGCQNSLGIYYVLDKAGSQAEGCLKHYGVIS